MKSLVDLLGVLLQECSSKCNAPILRDVITISRRVEHEGDSFLTITLPAFCSDFERCLDVGRVSPSDFPGFRRNRCRPAFLQAFMSQVFDDSGVLLEYPSLDCILAIRQVCLMFKKILRPCSNARLRNAEARYIECDNEVSNDPSGPLWDTFQIVCRTFSSSVLSDSMYEELVPKHGPGVTAERIRGNSKYVHRIWHSRLENHFPFTEFGLASVRNLGLPDNPYPNFVEPEDERPVRVVFVPKTLKTPRVIAIEPVCMQYAQQAYSKWLVSRLESAYLSRGHVNFRDQTINQALALDSSKTGRFATIDLSEASDRVSLAMVNSMFSCYPFLRDSILACRSLRANLPSGLTIHLNKFASMGSATCFPVEAMVFYCAIISSRLHRAKTPVSTRSVYESSRDVFVYGDDLIVPADEALTVSADLETLGFRINKRKSFWTGKFRESCGSDCYDGHNVTPCYVRRDFPANRLDSSSLVSWISLANQLFLSGWQKTSTVIKDAVESVVGKLPTVPDAHVAIGWNSYSGYFPPSRWNSNLHRVEFRCLVSTNGKQPDLLEGDGALAKCFLVGFRDETDQDHLLKSMRSWASALKTKWVPAF